MKNSKLDKFSQFAIPSKKLKDIRGGVTYSLSCGSHTPESMVDNGAGDSCSGPSYEGSLWVQRSKTRDVVLCFSNFSKGSRNYNLLIEMYGSDPCV